MTLTDERIDWIANCHCKTGVAYPYDVKRAIKEALRAAGAATQPAWVIPGSHEWAATIEGLEVSMDVSTGEDDAGNRVFGKVCEVMLASCGAGVDAILAIEDSRNFADPVSEDMSLKDYKEACGKSRAFAYANEVVRNQPCNAVNQAARTPASVGSIGEDVEFRHLLHRYVMSRSGFSEAQKVHLATLVKHIDRWASSRATQQEAATEPSKKGPT